MNHARLMSFRCVWLAALGLAFSISQAAAVDILFRSTGEIDFSGNPIPADFFGPGSLPFEGSVYLTGRPLGPFGADAVISRGPVAGGLETVPIELVALYLQSAAPIQVDFGSGPSSFFDIFVELDVPALGAMQLQQTSPSGGEIQGVHFENVDIVIGSLLPNLTVMDNGPMISLPPPVPYTFVGPPYYPGAPGFHPGPMNMAPEVGQLLNITLTPLPEPSSLTLAGFATVVLCLAGRRMRRRKMRMMRPVKV